MNRLHLIALILLLGCYDKPNTKTVTGDLYFSFVRPNTCYNVQDTIVTQSLKYFDSLALDQTELRVNRIIRHYKILKEKGLLFQPAIYLKTDNDSILTLHLDSLDYDKIKVHKRQELLQLRKRVRIEADVMVFDKGLYYCSRLRRVELIDGETLQRQGILKIKDYD